MKSPGVPSTTTLSASSSAAALSASSCCRGSAAAPQCAARMWRPSSLAPGKVSGQSEQATPAPAPAPAWVFISPLRERFCRNTLCGWAELMAPLVWSPSGLVQW